MKTIKFRIDGADDRRDLVAILADNGYWCKIIEKRYPYGLGEDEYYVVVSTKKTLKLKGEK